MKKWTHLMYWAWGIFQIFIWSPSFDYWVHGTQNYQLEPEPRVLTQKSVLKNMHWSPRYWSKRVKIWRFGLIGPILAFWKMRLLSVCRIARGWNFPDKSSGTNVCNQSASQILWLRLPVRSGNSEILRKILRNGVVSY